MTTRIDKIRKEMQLREIPALLITSEYNVRYATGFTGTTGLALLTMEEAFFVTDFRYTEQAAKQCQGYQIVQNVGSIWAEVAELVKTKHIGVLGFEAEYLSFSTYSQLNELLSCELFPVVGLLETIRQVKEPSEIATIQQACHIADAAFEHILTFIQPGVTEIEVANELDFKMRSLGASGVSFETIVASGLRSAMPHGVASEKVIEKGDIVTLDFGCYYNGYVSDMTRTIAVGDPGQKLKDIYQLVLEAQLRVIDAAKPGISGIELDQVARGYFAKHDCAEAFGHSTGHGIGLEIHEGPNVSKVAEAKFVVGNVITDEPGLYFPGIGGVRIEDDLLITEVGNQVLTQSPKELIIL